VSGDDDRARDAADTHFIVERLRALDRAASHDAKAAEDAYRRAILDLLRSGAVGPRTLRLTAGELERLWWPDKKRQRRDREQAHLWAFDDMMDYLTLKFQSQGKANPRTLAERAIAEDFGVGVEGLRKQRYRYRKRVVGM
jgi:hypothetical protein